MGYFYEFEEEREVFRVTLVALWVDFYSPVVAVDMERVTVLERGVLLAEVVHFESMIDILRVKLVSKSSDCYKDVSAF